MKMSICGLVKNKSRQQMFCAVVWERTSASPLIIQSTQMQWEDARPPLNISLTQVVNMYSVHGGALVCPSFCVYFTLVTHDVISFFAWTNYWTVIQTCTLWCIRIFRLFHFGSLPFLLEPLQQIALIPDGNFSYSFVRLSPATLISLIYSFGFLLQPHLVLVLVLFTFS